MRACSLFALAVVSSTTTTAAAEHDCSARILTTERRTFTGGAPATMPADLEWAYTRCGRIPRGEYYVDDTLGGQGTHQVFRASHMDNFLKGAARLAAMPNPMVLGDKKQGWLAEAFKRHADSSIRGRRCVVFGAMSPLVESLLLAFGAANVTTVEYNGLKYEHHKLRTQTPAQAEAELAQTPLGSRYECAVSISSFDHDGLGRYGDPLGPDSDLLANDRVRELYLVPGGTYFLTVPIGPDVVVWNLHRRYGPVRLPLLLEGWEEVERVGWPGERILTDTTVPFSKTTEPVFVMRSPTGAGIHGGGGLGDEGTAPGGEAAAREL
jgi:hypothetical protein